MRRDELPTACGGGGGAANPSADEADATAFEVEEDEGGGPDDDEANESRNRLKSRVSLSVRSSMLRCALLLRAFVL